MTSSYLFWALGGEIKRRTKDTGETLRVDDAAALNVTALAANETSFYWTSTDVTGTVERCDIGGCVNQTADHVAYGWERPVSLALSPAGFAFIAGPVEDRKIVYCTPTCGEPANELAKFLATVQADPVVVRLDATAAFWTNWAADPDGALFRAATVEPYAATPIAAGRNAAALALDATHAYFIAEQDGTIVKVPKIGGPSLVLAKNQRAARAIAVDDTRVYFTNAGPNGSVVWIAK